MKTRLTCSDIIYCSLKIGSTDKLPVKKHSSSISVAFINRSRRCSFSNVLIFRFDINKSEQIKVNRYTYFKIPIQMSRCIFFFSYRSHLEVKVIPLVARFMSAADTTSFIFERWVGTDDVTRVAAGVFRVASDASALQYLDYKLRH